MDSSIVERLDFSDRDEPTPSTDWRQLLTEWLNYHVWTSWPGLNRM
jgi:hypothetical protein